MSARSVIGPFYRTAGERTVALLAGVFGVEPHGGMLDGLLEQALARRRRAQER